MHYSDPIDPEAGNVGFMTWDQYKRLERAVQNGLKHMTWWRVCGNIKSGDPDDRSGGVKRGRKGELPIGLPASYLAADAISSYLYELNQWPELSDAVNDEYGYDTAIQLVREVETAMARWPISDRPHRVRYMRCQACDRETLKYYPPTVRDGELLDTTVKCTERDCRAVMDENMWLFAAALIKAEQERVEDARKRRLDSHRRRPGQGGEVEADDLPVGEGRSGEVVEAAPEAVVVSAGSVAG